MPKRPIQLRDDPLPADGVPVVRAGTMAADPLRASATDTFEDFGILAVSVFAALDETVEALCGTNPWLGRYRQVRLSSFGRVRSVGFPLVPTDDPPHYDILLPDLTDDTLDRLDACFEDPQPNPGRRRVGSG